MLQSTLSPFENKGRICAAEPKAIRQHAIEARIINALGNDFCLARLRVEIVDIGRRGNKIIVEHNQRINRLMGPGGALGMTG